VLVTFWLESNEHENCAGGESSTDRDQTEPAKVVRVCLEAAGQKKNADDPEHDC